MRSKRLVGVLVAAATAVLGAPVLSVATATPAAADEVILGQ